MHTICQVLAYTKASLQVAERYQAAHQEPVQPDYYANSSGYLLSAVKQLFACIHVVQTLVGTLSEAW